MADLLAAKAPTEIVERRWDAPVPDGDGALSVATSASGVTVDEATLDGDTVVLVLSGGTAAATGYITITLTTSAGLVLIETLYVPIIASTAVTAATALDYVNFALRKIVGVGAEATADELADAMERLNGLISQWRAMGADIGASYPMVSTTVVYCPEWAVAALRYNLLAECAPLYGAEPTPFEYEQARRGVQLVRQQAIPVNEVGYF